MTKGIAYTIQKHFNQKLGCVSALYAAMKIQTTSCVGGCSPGCLFVFDEHAGQNCAAVNRLRAVVLMNHDDSLSFALVARLAEHFFNLMRVIISTSSDYSYAIGGYFVGILPRWS